MGELAVTVIGHDRPGIVAAVTQALADLGGNLEDSSMTILRGHFAMTLVVSLPLPAAAVRDALHPVCERLGTTVSVGEVQPQAPSGPVGAHHVLTVHGADRPGIVAAVTGAVAQAGGNITDLTTRLTGELYVLVCEVDLPPDVDAPALSVRLQELAKELGVHASLRAADADLI